MKGRFSRLIASETATQTPTTDAARPRPRGIEARQGGARHQDQEEDLRGMVVDTAGNELAVADAAQHDQQGRRDGRSRTRQDAGRGRHGGDESGLESDRKNDARGPFRRIEWQHEFKPADQDRQDHIHDARPVHEDAVGWVQSKRREVEPALPGHPIAQLHGPHGVVGIEEGSGLPDGPRPRPRHGEGDRQGDGKGQHDRMDRATRRVVCGARH